MASSDSQVDKPQRGRPKRAELPDVNINTGAQSINTESLLSNDSALLNRDVKTQHQFPFEHLWCLDRVKRHLQGPDESRGQASWTNGPSLVERTTC